MLDTTLLLILSQLGTTLYPLLIKLVPTNLETQTAIRFITYSILALLGAFISDKSVLSYSILEYTGFGLINLIHVIASYVCFRLLSSGVSYTLFYTYPIFNVLGRMLFYGERIQPLNFIYVGIAFLGVYILTKGINIESLTSIPVLLDTTTNSSTKSTSATSTISSQTNQFQSILESNPLLIGAIAGILSAITESTMYLLVKDAPPATSAFQQISRFYLLGGVLGIIFLIYTILSKPSGITIQSIPSIDKNTSTDTTNESNTFFFSLDTLDLQLSWKPILEIILFNALVGFIGYTVVFYIIPRTGTLQFNTFIFLGIIFSYMWGYILNGETIPARNMLGSLLILFAIAMVNRK